jgi:alpha-N-acetylglucosamine transferase
VTQPEQLDKIQPKINWAHSHCLDGHYDGNYETPTIHPFLSEDNLEAFRTALRHYLTSELFWQWIDSLEKYPYLKEELYTLPDQFMAAFFSKDAE